MCEGYHLYCYVRCILTLIRYQDLPFHYSLDRSTPLFFWTYGAWSGRSYFLVRITQYYALMVKLSMLDGDLLRWVKLANIRRAFQSIQLSHANRTFIAPRSNPPATWSQIDPAFDRGSSISESQDPMPIGSTFELRGSS